jgi:nitric oxide reductase NorQ protein
MATASSTVADALAKFRAGETIPDPAPAPEPAAPAAPVKAGKAQRISFPRPNGELYFARQVTGSDHDVDMIRRSVGTTSIRDNMYILAYGAPGCGKTAALEAALPTMLTVEGDGDTAMDDFVGMWTQLPDGTYEWIDGPLIEAAEKGLPLFIDEIALIEPKVLAGSVYAAMDGRGKFRVKTNPRRGIINIKPGFTVVGACNPDAPGARMSEALLSRFSIHMEYTTDFDLAKSLGVPAKFITCAKNLQTKKEGNKCRYVPQMRELLAAKAATERYGIDFAAANFISIAPEYDRPVVADVVSRNFGSAIAPLRSGDAATVTV